MNSHVRPLEEVEKSEIEVKTMGKIFFRLMPFLFVCYIVAYLDRVNLSFAALQMNAELGFSPTQYATGVAIFVVGYVLFEVPSNLALQRFGARIWIARILITWGLLSAAMAFVGGLTSFYGLRFLVGAAEAGFVPGVFLYLTYWFPKEYRARVMSTFLLAVPVSSVFGSVISGYLLQMHGLLGLSGWQWLFLLEGVPAVLLGILCLMIMTSRPAQAGWLSEDQRRWLEERLGALGNTSGRGEVSGGHTSKGVFRESLSPRLFCLALINVCLLVGFWGLAAWLPQMVKQFVADNRMVGVVTAMPYLVGGLGMVVWARHSDRKQERVWHTAAAALVGGIGLWASTLSEAPVFGLIMLCISSVGIMSFLGLFWTLPSVFLDHRAQAVGLALIASIGNLGAMAGPYLMGWLKTHSGSFSAGLGYLSLSLILGAILTVALSVAVSRKTSRME